MLRGRLPIAFNRTAAAMAATVVVSASAWLSAQTPQLFEFVVSATNAAGAPVTDLKPEDVVMQENGVSQPVIKMEPLSVPLKLTIAVDNGLESLDALPHYRTALAAFVGALPADLEITLIATAPQPRMVVRPTTDRAQILKGINTFAPESTKARYVDTLVEYSDRLQREAKDKKAPPPPYQPVLLMLSTGGTETDTYQPRQIDNALVFLIARRAKVNTILLSARAGDVAAVAALEGGLQSLLGRTAATKTGGRYEALPIASRLVTLLPEWGRDLAALHVRQSKQFKVTVEREKAGELRNPRIELSRPGLTGSVTLDGILP